MIEYSVDNPHPDDVGLRGAVPARSPGTMVAYRVCRKGTWYVRRRDGFLTPSFFKPWEMDQKIAQGSQMELTL